MQMNDKEIIEHIINGEKEYFKELMMRYENRVYKMAYGMTLDNEDTKDIVQTTFLKVYKNIIKFNAKSSFLTWVLRIAYTTSIDFINKKNKNGHEQLSVNLTKNSGVISAEDRISIENALKELTERERAVFIMHARDGYKHREIADILGIKEGTVKALYFRAIDKLQTLLEGIL